MKNLNKRGGKGMLPACCLPHWGREGVTLTAATENKRITQKTRISTKPEFPPFKPSFKKIPDIIRQFK
jgi:hypothetical protein